jgi:hypothetical protein
MQGRAARGLSDAIHDGSNSEGWNNGGIRPAMDPAPLQRLVYFGVEAIDAGLSKVSELGGTRIIGPMDIGVDKIGVLEDLRAQCSRCLLDSSSLSSAPLGHGGTRSG